MIKVSYDIKRNGLSRDNLLIKRTRQFETMNGVIAFLRNLKSDTEVVGKPLIEEVA